MTAVMLGRAGRNLQAGCDQSADDNPPMYELNNHVAWTITKGVFVKRSVQLHGYIQSMKYTLHGVFDEDSLECEWLYTIVTRKEYDEMAAKADQLMEAYADNENFHWSQLIPKHFIWESDIDGIVG